MKTILGFIVAVIAFLGSLFVLPKPINPNEDFVPVYFRSGPELPEICVETNHPVVFHRTDGKLFYCSESSWVESK